MPPEAYMQQYWINNTTMTYLCLVDNSSNRIPSFMPYKATLFLISTKKILDLPPLIY